MLLTTEAFNTSVKSAFSVQLQFGFPPAVFN